MARDRIAARWCLTIGLLVAPASFDIGAADSLTVAGTLRTARSAHTASMLGSGKVLVVGGMSTGGGSLAAVELFDPANNQTRELVRLAEARAGHTATVLSNGQVIVAGGYNGEYLGSIEVFDAPTQRFRSGGSMLEARSGHTATLLPDGRILFVGGVGRGWSFLSSAEIYDPTSGRSVQVGAMKLPREGHTSTLLSDNRVLVVGGHAGRRPNVAIHSAAEVFSLVGNRFEPAGALVTPRHKHDALRLSDGRVLVIGGADRSDRVHFETTEIYDPKTGRFERGPSMAHRRYKIAGTSVVLPSGDVLVTSGASRAELLEMAGWKFREVPGRMPRPYRFAAAALLPDGDVFIAGGYDDENRNTGGIWRFRH